jgi:hypothetical protein
MLRDVRVKRWLVTAMALAPLLATSCTLQVGCVVYKLNEPGTPTPFFEDRSACAVTPPPVISEVHYVVLLPIAAAVVTVGAFLLMRRRRRSMVSA